jgi:hypothetical protein
MNYTITTFVDFLIILKDGTKGLFFDIFLIPIFLISLIIGKDYNSFIIGSFINTLLAMILSFIGLVSSISVGIWLGLLVFSMVGKFFLK